MSLKAEAGRVFLRLGDKDHQQRPVEGVGQSIDISWTIYIFYKCSSQCDMTEMDTPPVP